jgi:AcrR family transcriptional regulator
MLGYYFADKIDLIAHCVRLQQGRCAAVLEGVARDAATVDDLLQRFVDALAAVLRDDGPAQRLWYDLRLESLFEPSIREEVAAIESPVRDAIWHVVERYAELCDRRIVLDHDATYAVIDGVVAHLVMQQAAGMEGLEWLLAERIRVLMPRLLVVVD